MGYNFCPHYSEYTFYHRISWILKAARWGLKIIQKQSLNRYPDHEDTGAYQCEATGVLNLVTLEEQVGYIVVVSFSNYALLGL